MTDLYVRAARLCSSREHCTSQIREKLLSWDASAKEAEDIIKRLINEKFIDNRRFARAYCHDKFCYNHWGRTKIRQMLRHLQLSEEEIAEGMGTIPDESYEEKLSDLLQAKDCTLHETDPYRRKGKLVRHLLSKGFEMGLVVAAVDEYFSRKSL